MPVFITAGVPGQTKEGYDRAMVALEPLLEQAEGFIAHGAGMSPEGWRVFEVWESQDKATEAARYIDAAMERVIADARALTRDLGGAASTAQMGDAVATAIDRV